jgi:Cd2+/Zn2+-exporting ATPase
MAYPVTEQHLTLRIEGMDCADCALKLEKGVHSLPGVTDCNVSFASTRMSLVYDPSLLDAGQVERRVRAMGYAVAPSGQPATAGRASLVGRLRSRPRDAMTLLAGLLLLLAVAASLASLPPALVNGLYAVSIAIGGVFIFRKAWSSLRYNRELDINVLMTLAVAGAVLIGEWAEGAVVVFLFSLGEALEGYTMDQARNAIRSLMTLAPAEATVLRPCLDCAGHLGQRLPGGGVYDSGPCPWCEPHELAVPVEELAIGETVLVRPGERIPMDGVVLAGRSAVNQAPITGESLPVDKGPGIEVFAGSINGSGALEVSVTRLAADNTLSRLIDMVEEAQAQKAPAQRWIDRFARVYTPAVVAVAAAVAVLPSLFFGQPFLDTAGQTGWLYRALTLLVIACPCALVISTPVSIVSAISAAARHGVLIKGGVHLEALARVRVVAFDKTGTLTLGLPALIDAQCTAHAGKVGEPCAACDDVLALAAAVERRSEHPLAAAVVQAAEARSLNGRYATALDVEALAGQGVRGRVNGGSVAISSHRHIHELDLGHDDAFCGRVQRVEAAGQTTMLLHDEQGIRGYLAVADQVRPGSAAAVAGLKAAGIQRVVMLTGDNALTAQAIAGQTGIDEVRANLLPGDKVSAVEALLAEHGAVAMVGDGVNDAPALARATVGIAMGGAGSDQALETADIALMGDDLRLLPFVVRLSRQTRRVIMQNVAFSLTIKALFLGLALAGTATLWMAVFADVGASLLVILNGMRLLRARPAQTGLDTAQTPTRPT